jgi:3-deoxy-D-manno-octulosonic-acid transferase
VSYLLYRALTGALWAAALPWAAARRAAGNDEWAERMGMLPFERPSSVWVHAASVGEVAAAAPLLKLLSERFDDVVLTVVTPTGRDHAERTFGDALPAAFAPLDFVPAVRGALSVLRPRLLLLTETELWPNTIVEADRAGARVGVVNGRMSPSSLRRYIMPGSPFAAVARRLAFVAARSEADAGRFVRLGVDPSAVAVIGDMKYDKLEAPLPDATRSEIRGALGIPDEARVIVFGSVRSREEKAVAAAAAELAGSFPGLVAVVAPRHLDRVDGVVAALSGAGVAGVRRASDGRRGTGGGGALVLDSTGELARVYSIADVAFVGGTLADYGGHDPLEPAAQGVPVVLGPHTESCAESAERLLSGGGAVSVERPGGLAEAASGLLSDEARRAEAGRRALEVVESGRGAAARAMDFMRSMGVIDGAE